MNTAVAKAILRLWKSAKVGSSAVKLTRMKKLKELASHHGGVKIALKKAKVKTNVKMILRNDPGKKRMLKTKGELNQAQKHRR